MKKKRNTQKGKCRPKNYRAIRRSLQDGKRKWIKTTQNMPKTADDANDNMEKPKTSRTDKWKQKQKNETKENWGKETGGKYMTTWTSPDGNIRRQIDYIAINAKHRNVAKTAQINIYWHGNMDQNQQHRVQTMQLYYSAAKKYKKPIPTVTGTRIKYDLKELREHPEKLTESYKKYTEREAEGLEENTTGGNGKNTTQP